MDDDGAHKHTEEHTFVGRGGLKLQHALHTFKLDVRGFTCADFGCNVGGFTDCLLRAGAAQVYAVDTGYGALAWTLRNDPRVTVMERTNALHAPAPEDGVDLVVIDLAWTQQRLAIPAALRWLKQADHTRIITLIKPHYEAEKLGMSDRLRSGVLEEADAELVMQRVIDEAPSYGAEAIGVTRSPIVGGAGKRSKKASGNAEWLGLLRRM